MRLGIIELKDSHYTLIYSLVHIYNCEGNEILIFTTPLIQKYLGDLLKAENVRFVIKNDGDSLKSFLTTINGFQLDKVYITTFSGSISIFSKSPFRFPVNFFIHNIDEWERRSLFQQIRIFIEEVALHGIKNAGYQFKKQFIHPILIRQIHDIVLDTGGRFIVLNSLLKKHLEHIIPGERIEIIPFWIYDKRLFTSEIRKDHSRLRICIPGQLSTIRRDYLNFFRYIDENLDMFIQNFELILLGNVSPSKEEKGEDIIKAAESLNAKGFRIQFYTGFIPFQEYDRILSGSDILLGNVNTDLGVGKLYGSTKDSGVIYNMVHAAKPGFVPEGFKVADEFRDYIIVYEDYEQLMQKLLKLKNDKGSLGELQKKARTASERFEPYQIYKRIEKKTL